MVTHPRVSLLSHVISALRLWPVWIRLGVWDVRRRFTRSSLGVAWIFLNLAITLTAIGFIYTNLLGQDVRSFMPLLAAGLVIWGYITSSIIEGGNAFVASEGYIKQIGLPIFIYVLRSFVSGTFVFLLSFLAYVVVALVFRVPFGWGTLWALPGVLLLALVALLLTAIFATLNARFRDLGHLATAGMLVLFYVTPVIWPAEILRERGLGMVVDANPLYHLLEVVRRPLLAAHPASPLNYAFVMGLIGVLAIAFIIVGRRYLHRVVYFL